MSGFGIRPRFRQELEMGMDDLAGRLEIVAREGGGLVEVKKFPDYVCLRIPEEKRHFWSPRLNLSMTRDESGKTVVEGTYGPNGNVWGLYLYGYLFIGMAGIFSGILGAVQKMLGNMPWGLWICGAMAACAVGMYLAAQLGQKLAVMQTFHLHQVYEAAAKSHVDFS